MSTLTFAKPRHSSDTPAAPDRTGRPGGRILSGPLALVFLAEFCALTGFYLLPVSYTHLTLPTTPYV